MNLDLEKFLATQSLSRLPLSGDRRLGQNLVAGASSLAVSLMPPENHSGFLRIPSLNYELDGLSLIDTSLVSDI